MKLNELIERLEDIREYVGGDFQVRGAFQPNYVLLADISAVSTITGHGDDDGVYIALADARDYGSQDHYSDDIIDLSEEYEDANG